MPTSRPELIAPYDAHPEPDHRRRVILLFPHRGGSASRSSGVRVADHVVTLECDDVRLLALAADGLTPAGIGRRMALSERTVRRRLSRLCDRLGVSTPVQAVVWAVRHGVI